MEWTTLTFFAGLFIIVGALAETGTIDLIAQGLVNLTGGNVFATMFVLLAGPVRMVLGGASGRDLIRVLKLVGLAELLGAVGLLVGVAVG